MPLPVLAVGHDKEKRGIPMPKQDRRIRRTQRLLKESLSSLMQEKDFKDITVKEITDRADLNRGTFYLHYTDPYDLLKRMEQEVLDDFQSILEECQSARKDSSLLPILRPIADYIEENHEICKILFDNTASHDFIQQFHDFLKKNGLMLISQQYPNYNLEYFDYFCEYTTHGITGIIRQWLHTALKQPKEDLLVMTDKMITTTAMTLLQIDRK